jgi:hypothetical protein
MHALNEPFEIPGDWFLPEKPESIIAGKLNYDGSGQTDLTLNGSFQPLWQNVSHRYSCIHGLMNNGHAATLLDAQQSGTTLASASAGVVRLSEKITSHALIIGRHVMPETKYESFHALIPGLEIWMARPSVVTEFEDKSSKYTFKIADFPNEEMCIQNASGKLVWYLGNEVQQNQFQSLNVKISAGICFQPDQPQPLIWLYTHLAKVTSLLTLLSGTPMFASHLSAGDKAGHPRSHVDLLQGFQFKDHCTFTNPSQFFMPRDKMATDFSEVVIKWFDLYEKIKSPINLAISIFISKGLWTHVEFLSLMQALEGFHRALFSGTYMPDAEYKRHQTELEKAIPKEFTPDHRNSMKARLRYGNEISLAKRLNDLSELLSIRERKILFGKDGDIPRVWIDTRNYYTHWSDELRSKILDDRDLYFANARLRSFLRVLYLAQTGIPSSAIEAVLYGFSPEAQFLIQIFNAEKTG